MKTQASSNQLSLKRAQKFIRWMGAIGTQHDLPPFLVKRVQYSNYYTLFFGAICLLYGAYYFLQGAYFVTWAAMIATATFWSSLFLSHWGWITLSRMMMLFSGNMVIYVFSSTLGRDSGIHFWFFVGIQAPFVVFDLRESKKIFVSVMFSVAAFLFLWMTRFQYRILPPVAFAPSSLNRLSEVSILGSVLTIFSISFFIFRDSVTVHVLKAKSDHLLQDHIRAVEASSFLSITDAFGKIIHVNDEFCRISGYSREELLGHTHAMLKSGLHSREFFGEMTKTILSGQIWKGEICNRSKDGSLYWLHTTITPVIGQNGQIERFVAIRFDVTQIKELQNQLILAKEERETELIRELKASQAQLFQSVKMASLGVMSSGLAHELNNPLMFIKGFNNRIKAALKKHGQVSDREIGEFVDEINRSADRMKLIIQHFRDFSRQSSHEKKQIRLNEVIKKSLTLFNEQLVLKNIVTQIHLSPDELLIEGDANRLEQVFFNFIANSIHALESAPIKKEKMITISSEKKDTQGVVKFIDNGAGIPEKNLSRLFDPFFTTKEVGQGTGLGLSIADGIIRDHSGKISVESRVGEGTVFTVQFPILESSSGGNPRAAA